MAKFSYLLALCLVVIAPLRHARADDGIRVQVDLRALRDGRFGSLAESLYLESILAFEGTLHLRDTAGIVVDRVDCEGTDLATFRCRVEGSLSEATEAALRARAHTPRGPIVLPTQTSESGRESILASLPEGTQLRLLPCDRTRFVVATGVPTSADCTPRVGSSRGDAPPVAVSFVGTSIESPYDLIGVEEFAYRVRVGETVDVDLVFRARDEDEAVRVEARVRREVAARRFRLPERISDAEGTIARDGSSVVLRFALDPDEVEAGWLAFVRRGAAAEPTLRLVAPEPWAEYDDHERRMASVWGINAYRTSGTDDPNLRVIVLTDGDFEIGSPTISRLATELGQVRAVLPDTHLPHWSFVWAGRGADARDYVERSLRATNDGTDPCIDGCVVVAVGAATDLAFEMATLDPLRYRAIVAYGASRPMPLDPLATIERAPSGVPVRFVRAPTDLRWTIDETDRYLARWSALTRRPSTTPEIAASLVDVVRATVAETPTRARAGVVSAMPSGGTDACRDSGATGASCLESPRDPGDERTLADLALACLHRNDAACVLLDEAWRAEARTPAERNRASIPIEIACSRGHAAACRTLGERFGAAPDERFERNILFRAACTGGDGSACRQLGYAFYEGVSMPRSPFDDAMHAARACELGDAFGCSNLDVALHSYRLDRFPEPHRTRLTIAACDAGRPDACRAIDEDFGAADRAKAQNRLRNDCLSGIVGACTSLDRARLDVRDRRELDRVLCLTGTTRSCDEARISPQNREDARAELLARAATACAARSRFACLAIVDLLQGSTAANAPLRRADAYADACLLGFPGACLRAVDGPTIAREAEVLEAGCDFGIDAACDRRDALNGATP